MNERFIVTPDDVEEVLIKNGIRVNEDLVMSAYYSLDYDLVENAPVYSQIDDQFEAIEHAKAEIEIQLRDNGFFNQDNEYKILPNYNYAFDRLNAFKNEDDNWDGYGGLPASEEASKDVEEFLKLAQDLKLEEPGLCMGGDGSVGVVWCKDDIYVACDFDGRNRSYVFIVSKNEDLLLSGESFLDNTDEKLLGFLFVNFS